jgi:hypothetical protein
MVVGSFTSLLAILLILVPSAVPKEAVGGVPPGVQEPRNQTICQPTARASASLHM